MPGAGWWGRGRERGGNFLARLDVCIGECWEGVSRIGRMLRAGCVPSLSPDSEPTQCTMLYSRQGTTETIAEVEAEQDDEAVAKDADQGGEEAADLGPEETSEASEAGLTPDAELPHYSTEDGDVEAPPSYSKAVSFERLSFCSRDDSAGQSHMAVSPDESRSDRLESSILPPLTHELTASELLLNK